MKSYLPTKKIRIESLGQELELRGLSTAEHIEISDTKDGDEKFRGSLLTCKFGVVEWADESIEDIAKNVSIAAVNEIARHVYTLSGVDMAKNSDSATDDDSSSD